MASYGHIRELSGLEAINIHDNFTPTFTECKNKKDHISKLRKGIKEAAEVILATDDDREGEAIAWHLCQVFQLPPEKTRRIIFHEITETAIHKAIEQTTTYVNMAVVNAQLGRQVLDLLVGYKLSPLLWKHVKDGLSAGRCQTPALRLIYENQKEIETRPGKEIYTLTGVFTNKNLSFELNHEETDPLKVQEFLKASMTFVHTYLGNKAKTLTKPAPAPFTTSTLQQTASNECHYSPKDTMKLCQSLYEAGYITYHRTDSTAYSAEFITQTTAFIKKNYGEAYVSQAYVSQAYVSQSYVSQAYVSQSYVSQSYVSHTQAPAATPEPAAPEPAAPEPAAPEPAATPEPAAPEPAAHAHEAIRPTDIACDTLPDTFTSKEKRLYALIRTRALESCMQPATISVLTAIIAAPLNYEYHYTAENIIFAGWQKVTDKRNADDANTNANYSYIQSFKQNYVFNYKKIKATMHLRELKAHYTEARLVQLLEEKGIGRPSTFSSLIDKIQERNYVKKENIKGKMLTCLDYELSEGKILAQKNEREFGNEKNKLIIQPLGILALEFLLKHFEPFFDYTYTKQMEEDLDKVATDNMPWPELCKTCHTTLENLSATILEKGKETIRIDANHTYIVGKHGPVIKCVSTTPNKKEDNITFKPVRKDLDLNKLRRGEYRLEDVIETAPLSSPSIGLYQNEPVYIKKGKFGVYLEWTKNGKALSKSLKGLKKKMEEIELDDVAEILYDLDNHDSSILRQIGPDASIRKGGDFGGDYIFYKNKKMKKPRFLQITGFTGDYLTCELTVLQEWFLKVYQISP
jgi:DNA topoisomerase-1